MPSIDINCDLGEGLDNDEQIMQFISSANIACGYHAGDEASIRKAIQLAKQHGVSIGAHPGFADKENFGRKEISLPGNGFYELVREQLVLFKRILEQEGGILHHVKAHGALYNMAAANPTIAVAIAEAVRDFDASLIFYGLSGSCMLTEVQKLNLKVASEVFADRTYQENGSLTPRSHENALLDDVDLVARQALLMAKEKKVMATNGKKIPVIADTICIHGDGSKAVAFARIIHHSLKEKGIEIKSI
jgi:UPF0271 protein